MLMGVMGLSLCGGARLGLSAAGAPPGGPIEAVHTGADLKFACGQDVDGYQDVVGEKIYRLMLIVQCRAVVGTVADLIKAGQYALDDAPKWQCVEIPEDVGELSATFVTWVGRSPTLLRKPAAVALVEAIELSAPCDDA
jgi:hypothetical protein